VNSLVEAAILPFGLPTHLTSDHRALLLDFDSKVLFGNAAPPLYIAQRRSVYSNTIPLVTKFSQMVGEGCDEANLNDQIRDIKALATLVSTSQGVQLIPCTNGVRLIRYMTRLDIVRFVLVRFTYD